MKQLHDMLESQNYNGTRDITYKTLPKIGFIVQMHKTPIAVGFLRRLEGGFAQIDTLASNAHFGGMIRHEGLTMVVNELILTAKQLKLSGLICHTKDQGILTRAASLGFYTVDQTIIALKL